MILISASGCGSAAPIAGLHSLGVVDGWAEDPRTGLVTPVERTPCRVSTLAGAHRQGVGRMRTHRRAYMFGGLLGFLGLMCASAALMSAPASAANGPTAVIMAATALGSTTVTLNGTVNPNGIGTNWSFE